MKCYRVITIAAFAAAILAPYSLGGCAKKAPSVSPQSFNAQRVVGALDVLRDTAVSANAQTPKLLSDANTRLVVNFHESAVKTIAAVPGGWKAAVSTALGQLQTNIPAAEYQRIAPYVSLVQTLIATVIP